MRIVYIGRQKHLDTLTDLGHFITILLSLTFLCKTKIIGVTDKKINPNEIIE
jgi:hypothetical protein